MARALDVSALIEPHQYAAEISNRFTEWNSYRQEWLQEKKELRNYVFATDTRTTSNSKLPWSNSTTTPKITQIYDNLKANYTTALFPNSKWMKWEATDEASATKAKRDTIQTYMENKLVLILTLNILKNQSLIQCVNYVLLESFHYDTGVH